MTQRIARFILTVSLLTPNILTAGGPTGGKVVGGQGTIEHNGSQTTIHQNSHRMAIDWETYNLTETERVQYHQPSASAVSLNRIYDQNPSQILGQIDANGIVFLVNPRGVFFGETATLNVGSLVASGLDIKTDDFMRGKYIFKALEGTGGAVVNQGAIKAAAGGAVALLGKTVVNGGTIRVVRGRISLTSATEARITFDQNGYIGLGISTDVLKDKFGIDTAVLNTGRLEAEGEEILMTAKMKEDLWSTVVNHGDLVRATGVEYRDGGVFLVASGGNTGGNTKNTGTIDVSSTEPGHRGGDVTLRGDNVNNSGTIKADAAQGDGGTITLESNDTTTLGGDGAITARSETGGQGGAITVLGDNVGLFDQASIDASGANGGGTVLIGGDEQGLNPEINNASAIYLGEGTHVKADGLENGDGGKVIAYADGSAKLYGALSAQGGAVSGNGGFVETSGKESFQIV